MEANRKVYTVLYAAASGGGAGSLTPILMIALLFVVMYFMMIRPQQKRRREAEQMQSALAPGDEVVTIGGLHGTVTAVEDETVLLEVAPGVQTRYARPAVARVIKRAEAPAAETITEEAEPVKE
ncbi:preprotein translocase, YajC subunit [Micromonospora sp. L5]|uniref:Preprotein translocase subunit YajC n=1 Tax=Micromonospora aurantiaca (nom. illeg.) TaxID=47850 RepID=A0A1C6SMH6_9ACTN|nr:preprotein translocase, YajC subunit [Micromonospora aurantiaca ATCC 27029]ADU07925.1 preprotein translocase, YajC subunit [Micromonospora sp. L5]AXH91890.1 preprotein translocase subunit YajC [Micromonospora aurantiaca]OHX03061.1 preprotein translocase subunit YajC [Micromonospora sp. WMMB235]KAB1112158.1 preprotein translocase subunit YajC [Micromonospora aurantiaca]